ncbi:MAG TPA: hypothetical protein VGT44_06130, partial [Ktedonobacteraceae bacterium]|nr:hypothetical protein [Ktedonobacteraceae bacterium]
MMCGIGRNGRFGRDTYLWSPTEKLNRKLWYAMLLCLLLLLAGCGAQAGQIVTDQALTSDNLNVQQHITPTVSISIPQQAISPTPASSSGGILPKPGSPPTNIPGSGIGPAPYGPPPTLTTQEIQLTQQLFALI